MPPKIKPSTSRQNPEARGNRPPISPEELEAKNIARGLVDERIKYFEARARGESGEIEALKLADYSRYLSSTPEGRIILNHEIDKIQLQTKMLERMNESMRLATQLEAASQAQAADEEELEERRAQLAAALPPIPPPKVEKPPEALDSTHGAAIRDPIGLYREQLFDATKELAHVQQQNAEFDKALSQEEKIKKMTPEQLKARYEELDKAANDLAEKSVAQMVEDENNFGPDVALDNFAENNRKLNAIIAERALVGEQMNKEYTFKINQDDPNAPGTKQTYNNSVRTAVTEKQDHDLKVATANVARCDQNYSAAYAQGNMTSTPDSQSSQRSLGNAAAPQNAPTRVTESPAASQDLTAVAGAKK